MSEPHEGGGRGRTHARHLERRHDAVSQSHGEVLRLLANGDALPDVGGVDVVRHGRYSPAGGCEVGHSVWFAVDDDLRSVFVSVQDREVAREKRTSFRGLI